MMKSTIYLRRLLCFLFITLIVSPVLVADGKPSVESLERQVKELQATVSDLSQSMVRRPRTDFDPPKLDIRGFGHFQYDFKNEQKGTTVGKSNNFTNGGIDLFITSKISRKLSFLNETIFEFAENGGNVLDVERLLLKYEHSDELNISIGRGHTALGYWNQRFHHGVWLQTTTNRPNLYAFEDDGGIMPIHSVGIELSGNFDTGIGNIAYVSNVSNGRGRIVDEVQLIEDDNDSKMVSLMATFKPEGLSGFGFGGNVLFDVIPNDDSVGRSHPTQEIIAGFHAFYIDSQIEWIAEFQSIDHDSLVDNASTGGYMQFSYGFDDIRPYYRFDFLRIDSTDTYFPGIPDLDSHTVGVRYDWFPFAAIKVEYRYSEAGPKITNAGTAQVSFAF